MSQLCQCWRIDWICLEIVRPMDLLVVWHQGQVELEVGSLGLVVVGTHLVVEHGLVEIEVVLEVVAFDLVEFDLVEFGPEVVAFDLVEFDLVEFDLVVEFEEEIVQDVDLVVANCADLEVAYLPDFGIDLKVPFDLIDQDFGLE